jgi:hypothetical protein
MAASSAVYCSRRRRALLAAVQRAFAGAPSRCDACGVPRHPAASPCHHPRPPREVAAVFVQLPSSRAQTRAFAAARQLRVPIPQAHARRAAHWHAGESAWGYAWPCSCSAGAIWLMAVAGGSADGRGLRGSPPRHGQPLLLRALAVDSSSVMRLIRASVASGANRAGLPPALERRRRHAGGYHHGVLLAMRQPEAHHPCSVLAPTTRIRLTQRNAE